MSEDRQNRKRFRSDGTSIWTKRAIDGPGVWATCVKGKERSAVGELYDVFESLADELWPEEASTSREATTDKDARHSDEVEEEEVDVEKAIAKEVLSMKRPRREKRFTNFPTGTTCMVFMACKPPIDPTKMICSYMAGVEKTGISRTRHIQRLVPVNASCDANEAEIKLLCNRYVVPHFVTDGDPLRYKIELRIRNHNTMKREDIIKTIASCVPEEHKVDLTNPDLFILVEIFKGACGISVVRDYYRLKKFNVAELARSGVSERTDS